MESLPVELLTEIFGHFCFHCQHPGIFPNADFAEVRSDKRSLAYLCRTSKTMCAVAQPILYHYYATGNNRVETKVYRGHDVKRHMRPAEPSLLPRFVHTLLRRPDLASRITVMHIVLDMNKIIVEKQMEMIESVFRLSICYLMFEEPNISTKWYERWNTDCCTNELEPELLLAVLAMTFAPGLEHLLLVSNQYADFSSYRHILPLKLPSLRTLGLIGDERSCHFDDPRELYAAAPKLETIYALNAGAWGEYRYGHSSVPERSLQSSNLKRLAISNLVPDRLPGLIHSTPKLECLEYFWDGKDKFNVEDMAELLRPIKNTLKKLCIGFIPSGYDADHDPFPKCIEPPEVGYPPLRTLREFGVLEDLSIDCFALYPESREPDDANRLVTLLPQSIRKLRITYIYRGVDKCLRQLAEDAPAAFPSLKEVVVGIAARTDPAFDCGIDKVIRLGGLFARSGIRFSWKKDLLGPDPRTMIPGAMPGSNYIPLPQVMDEIDKLAFEEDE